MIPSSTFCGYPLVLPLHAQHLPKAGIIWAKIGEFLARPAVVQIGQGPAQMCGLSWAGVGRMCPVMAEPGQSLSVPCRIRSIPVDVEPGLVNFGAIWTDVGPTSANLAIA